MTLLAGAGLFYFHHNFDVSGTLKKEVFGVNSQKTDSSGLLENFRFHFPHWTERLLANKELVLYGALGFLAVSIFVLIAGNTSGKARDPKDSMLEVLMEEKRKAEHLAKDRKSVV